MTPEEKAMRMEAAAAELAGRLAEANARCANFAGDLAAAQARIAELEAEKVDG